MSFFNDLFKGITGATKAVTNASNVHGGSTYSSQVPWQADYGNTYGNGSNGVPASTTQSQIPHGSIPANGANYTYDPNRSYDSSASNRPGGSTYNSQVPREASQPAVSMSSSGQSNSGTTNSGGGGSGGGNGGGGGSAPAVVAPPPAPAPPPPPPPPTKATAPASYTPEWEVLTIPDAESNAQYVAKMAALQKALKGYEDQDTTARGQKMDSTDLSLKDLGWDDPDKFAGKKAGHWDTRGQGSFGRSYVTNENDFAGRGAMTSGYYEDAVKNMLQDYSDRRTALEKEQTDWTAAQDVNLQNTKDEEKSNEGTAKADTVAQIAANLGVDENMVLSGFGTGGANYRRRIDEAAKGDARKYVKTSYKTADEANAASKAAATARQKAAQTLLDQKYQDELDAYNKKYKK